MMSLMHAATVGLCMAQAAAPTAPLSKEDAQREVATLWTAHAEAVRAEREQELKSGAIEVGGVRMPIACTVYPASEGGKASAPPNGRSLWISMHGGGGAPAAVNDKQWENQKRLYQPEEGVYVAPRAPTNEWNLWHLSHIDALFARLIEDMVIVEGVDPDRVYIMGYSAGGDGVYQLAPRMADRWAAAAMMAGHPNDAKPDGLRNIGFTLHMGANDGAYDRNKVASQWKERLAALEAADPKGYKHWAQLHEGKGHWMDRQDAAAVPWMAKFTRDLRPTKIVWLQDDVVQPRFYWLAVDAPVAGARIVAERDGQTVRIVEAPPATLIRIRLDDRMLDLDQDVRVVQGDRELFKGRVARSRDVMARTLAERGDPQGIFAAEVVVQTAP
ncbi:MAG: alpha/beta hydrolase [Phycisphaerae bacterium]|nr:alpha/beta hydrolase [Phycisphaerae bacterium]